MPKFILQTLSLKSSQQYSSNTKCSSRFIIRISFRWPAPITYHSPRVTFSFTMEETLCAFQNSFKSSVRKRRSNSASGRRHRTQPACPFVVKQVPFSHIRPLLVFINPRSGGNQGVKLMHKFNWYLNPRQVFDLSQPGGPKKGWVENRWHQFVETKVKFVHVKICLPHVTIFKRCILFKSFFKFILPNQNHCLMKNFWFICVTFQMIWIRN